MRSREIQGRCQLRNLAAAARSFGQTAVKNIIRANFRGETRGPNDCYIQKTTPA